MMCTYQQKKEQEFITEGGGGIRERMTAARLGYRTNQRETIEQLSREIEALKQENDQLKKKRITCKTVCQEDYQMLASKKPRGCCKTYKTTDDSDKSDIQ